MIRHAQRAGLACVMLGLAAWLGACNQKVPDPTPTQDWPTADFPPLAASATVNPVPPVLEGDEIHSAPQSEGANNPTQAALAAEGQPAAGDAPTLTPAPTQASLPMSISAADGRVLQATFYGAAQRPSPGILLIHMEGQDRHSWDDLAGVLQSAGYSVLTFDLRGYGETGGTADWTRAPGDVANALELMRQMPDINPIAIIGASIGANLGLNACAELNDCATAVLLSPGIDYQGITTADGMARLATRPVLIISGDNDGNNPADSMLLDGMAAGEHQLLIYPGAGHGTELFSAQPGLSELIVEWLLTHIPPPYASPTPIP